MNEKKSSGAIYGAAFLMATSAIGPGFLTQTASFTGRLNSSFGIVVCRVLSVRRKESVLSCHL